MVVTGALKGLKGHRGPSKSFEWLFTSVSEAFQKPFKGFLKAF
jgi:hypothetical protein